MEETTGLFLQAAGSNGPIRVPAGACGIHTNELTPPPPLPVPISNGDEVLWLSVDRIKCLVRRASKTIKHTMLAKLLFSTYTAQRASRADFDCGRVDVCRQYLYLFVCSLPHYAYLTCFGACCTLNPKPQART